MIDTEKALLGCMILDNKKIPEVISNIDITDFKDVKCRKTYKRIIYMFNKNEKIDLITLSEALKPTKIPIESIVEMIEIVPTIEACNNYIKRVKDNSSKRSLLNTLNNFQYKLKNNDFNDIESFKSECIESLNINTGINSVLDTTTFKYLENFLQEIKENKNKPIISTGFPSLNRKLGGGIFPGLYVLGAISSLGKSTFVLQIADQIAANGHSVLYISTEMPKNELVSRSISRHMFQLDREKCKNVGTLTILRGRFYEYLSEIDTALKNYSASAKNLIIQKCDFNANIKDIKSIVKAFINKANKNPVVIVDYLQTIKADGFNDKQICDNVVAGLKGISNDFSIPVIAVSSFNRNNYSSRVDFESFKESGIIEYTADVVIALQLNIINQLELSDKNKHSTREAILAAKKENPRKISVVILKQRNSLAGATQDFLYYPVNNTFLEV
ncbi:MAG: DnaB-like helicase C-terminal domain-containing protein [Clostridiales bacterium]